MSPAEPYVPGVTTVDDLWHRARRVLSPGLFAHAVGGAGDERTMAANRAGFGRYRLVPRVLLDADDIDTGVNLLGTRLGAPVFTCPTGGISAMHPDGEPGVARAAAAAGVGFILSGSSGVTLEDVAAEAGPARWHQLYWQGDRAVMADLALRAKQAGYRAVVLTVDSATRPRRPRMVETGFKMPVELGATNLQRYATAEWEGKVRFDARGRVAKGETDDVTLTWPNVEWLRSVVELPFVLKGIMGPEDAVRSIEAGADAVMISNHGGRYLESEPGTIEVLESVVGAVDGRIPVLVDGGFRKATDVVIALGLGAAAVGIGMPVVLALACGGEDMVEAYLTDLVDDLERALGILGCSSVAALTRDRVSRKDEFLPDPALVPFLPPR